MAVPQPGSTRHLPRRAPHSPDAHTTQDPQTLSTICTSGSTTCRGWERAAGRVGYRTCQTRAAALYKGCYIPSALPAHSTRLMNLLTVSNTEYLLKQIT